MYICIIISLLWEYWNRLNKSTDVFRRLSFTDFYFIYDKQIDLICQKSEILTNCSQILDIPSTFTKYPQSRHVELRCQIGPVAEVLKQSHGLY